MQKYSQSYMYTADYMPKLLPVLGLIKSTDFIHWNQQFIYGQMYL